MGLSSRDRKRANTLFYFMLAANACLYLEAGAVPAVLLQIGLAFSMNSGQQGLLGGIVYLALSIGGPFAGYLLRRYSHKRVLSLAVTANCILTTLWACTPVGHPYSSVMYIGMRFLMGLAQCVICVFLPLWTNEYAPRDKRASWMSYLQASVPLGVMGGYVIASLVLSFSDGSPMCGSVLCFRVPFFVEVVCMVPVCIGIFIVPADLLSFKVNSSGREGSSPSSVRSRAAAAAWRLEAGVKKSSDAPEEEVGGAGLGATEATPLMSPSKEQAKRTTRGDAGAGTGAAGVGGGIGGLGSGPVGVEPRSVREVRTEAPSSSSSSSTCKSSLPSPVPSDAESMSPLQMENIDVPGDQVDRSWDYRQYHMQSSLYTPVVTRMSSNYPSSETHASRDHLPGLEELWLDEKSPMPGDYSSTSTPATAARGREASGAVLDLRSGGNGHGDDADFDEEDGINTHGGAKDEEGHDASTGSRSASATAYDSITGLDIRKKLRSALGIAPQDAVQRSVQPPTYETLSDAAREWQTRSGPESGGPSWGWFLRGESPTSGDTNGESPKSPDTKGTTGSASAEAGATTQRSPSKTSGSNGRHLESHRQRRHSSLRSSRSVDTESDASEDEAYTDGATDSTCPTVATRTATKKAHGNKGAIFASLTALWHIPVYCYLLGAQSSLYFTVTGVQYWGTSYMTVALGAPEALANSLFVVCAATGPTLGVFFGGWAIDRRGGYKGPLARIRALELCSLFGLAAACVALVVSFVEDIWVFAPLLWLLLFLGGSILPACSGIVVSVVPRRHRTVSSSVSLVVFNLLGYSMSLLLSGYFMQFLNTFYPDCDFQCTRFYGFRVILYWAMLAVTWLLLATHAARKMVDENGNLIRRRPSGRMPIEGGGCKNEQQEERKLHQQGSTGGASQWSTTMVLSPTAAR